MLTTHKTHTTGIDTATITQDTIIIFGGAGFIGKNLIKKITEIEDGQKNISKKPSKIIVIDKSSEALDGFKNSEISNKNIDYFQFDLSTDLENFSDLDFLDNYYEQENGNNVSIILLASSLGPQNVASHDSINDYLINFNMYHYLINTIEKFSGDENSSFKFNKILFASTSEGYGDIETMDENGSVLLSHKEGFRLQYALQKLTAENLFLNFGKNYNQEVIITRIFNCVGKGQKEGFVVSNFNKIFRTNLNILRKNVTALEIAAKSDNQNFPMQLKLEKYKIFGDGSQSRVFIDVDELTTSFLLLLNYKERTDILPENKIINNIINIANIKNNITILNLVLKYLDLYKEVIINLISDSDFSEKTLEYLNNELIDIDKALKTTKASHDDKLKYISFEEGPIGQLKRNPLVFKLYKVLKYKPSKNIVDIIKSSVI